MENLKLSACFCKGLYGKLGMHECVNRRVSSALIHVQEKKLMKRVMMLVAVVGGIVQMAVGADTHDYSNYIVLNCSPTVSNHWPTANQWNPAGEMNEDGYYLIPKGKTLTTKTGGAYGSGGTWPMAELAIAGKFAASASSSRDGVAITPRLALCAGGTIALSSA